MTKNLKKILAILLTLSMVMSMISVTSLAAEEESGEETAPAQTLYCDKEEHTHSIENGCYELICGKEEAEAVEGHDCEFTHEHDGTCGYVAPTEEVPCNCTEIDENGAIVHEENCGYQPASEGSPCTVEAAHEHDENCGFVEAVEGHAHTGDCYDTTTAICDKEEHTHTAECYIPAVWDAESGTLTITGVEYLDQATALDYVKKLGTKSADVKALVLNGVTEIAPYAFYPTLWTALEAVNIDGTDSIGGRAFAGLPKLETVSLTDVKSVGTTATEPAADGNAFAENRALTTLTLNRVDLVGRDAFRTCPNLTSLTITDVKILGQASFSACNGLTELELKDIELGTNPFYQCANLETVTLDNVTFSGVNTFDGCAKLKNATLKNMDSVGNNMFVNCANLENVTIDNVKNIGANLFSGKVNLKTVTITGENVTIGQSAFLRCTALSDVELNGVTTVGPYAFQYCTSLESIELDGVTTIDQYAFSKTGLKQATLTDIDTIGQRSFWDNAVLETVTMTGIDTIDNYAFWGCSNLKTIDSLSNVKSRIGGFAFYGCSSLTGLTVEDMTKMGYNGSVEMMERMQAILAGKFQLDDAAEVKELALEGGWTAGDVNKSENWNGYDNGTQLMEQARWQDADNGVAQVKVDAYYTGEKQMDYIFVADLSASMAQLGNPEDSNARFYDMQSKLLDMTGKLLNTPGYDCQVAIVTFGGLHAGNATANVMEFSKNAGNVATYIKALEPLNENTDYGLGMQKALGLVQGNTTRNTVIVFLSDGAPYTPDGIAPASGDLTGTTAAAGIHELNVPIYGVLHSPTNAQHDKAKAAMEAVCGQGNVYESTDTDSFGQAMNKAFTSVYGNNTVTIPVNAEQFDVSNVSASAGTVEYSNGTITWTLNGMPFTQHTLTYTMGLKDELADRIGTYSYSINNGQNATFGEGGASVGLTLTLSRTVNPPYTPPTTYTLNYNANGGEGAPAAQSQTSGRTFIISAVAPTRENYSFAGWALTAGAEEAVCQPGEQFTINAGTSQTLYAVWASDEDLEDPDTPTTESPDVTGSPEPVETQEPDETQQPSETQEPDETEDLGDNDTPLAENPGESEDLGDNDTPLADVPQTGDMLWLWILLAVGSAAGLVWISLEEKKGKRVA